MPAAVGHKAFIEIIDAQEGPIDQTGYVLYRLIQTSTRPFAWTVNANMPAQDATGFAGTAPIVRTQRGDGLGDWNASATAYFPKAAPLSGHVGAVTFAGGYDTCAEAFTVDFQFDALDATCMNSVSAPVWREFQPGLGSGTGTYRCKVAADEVPTLVGQTGSATFQLSTGSPANTIVGSITINSATIVAQIGDLVMVDYSFTFDGQVTFAGGGSLVAAGNLVEPEITEGNIWIVNDAEGYNGLMFLTGLSASVAIGSPIEVSISVQGTGAIGIVTT